MIYRFLKDVEIVLCLAVFRYVGAYCTVYKYQRREPRKHFQGWKIPKIKKTLTGKF